MVNCPECGHHMEHPPVDHWVDFAHTRASIICDSCGRHFECWACEL